MAAGNLWLRQLCKREYLAQRYVAYNERAVEYSFVFRQLGRYCPKAVLDVGTGATALPQLIRQCGFIVTAVDNVKDYWSKEIFNRHFYIIKDDITSSNLKMQFNMITCISVLEHIRNHRVAVSTMFSLLQPGGHLLMTFPYNEKQYVENVYILPGSQAPKGLPFITQAFSRKQLSQWVHDNNAALIEQEYWRYHTGEYWTVGERLPLPEKSDRHRPHQITCILLKK